MKLPKLVLTCAIASSCVNAFEVCNIGDEYKVLDRETFHNVRKSNYRNFSEGVTSDTLFSSAPEHHADIRPSLAEAEDVFPATASLLEVGPVNVAVLEAEEAASLLATIGRSTAGFAKGVFNALGPVGDTIAVGLWANDVAHAFEDETKTSYDRFATVMSLIDWFGVLNLPKRDIDHSILTARWNRVAAGEHYSFTVHDDIITQQDKKDKQHWAALSTGQQRMLEALAKGYATDIALKYQQHYQVALKAQAVLTETLINSVESEVQKAIFNKLALEGANTKLFPSDLASTCRPEIDALLALYPEHEENNGTPMYVPSKRVANRALARLQHCQQDHLDLTVAVLNKLRNEEIEGLDSQSLHQLHQHVLNAKIKIVKTAHTQLGALRAKLKQEMYAEGLKAIDRLFDSEAVAKAHRYFKEQADYLAIDEMSRSIFGRPATATEQHQKYFVIQEGYQKCSRVWMLSGSPSFVECTGYTWIPEEREHYDSAKDDVISQMVMPNRDAIKRVFTQTMDALLNEGWRSQHEEAWLEQQLLSHFDKQRFIRQADADKARVMRWVFDSSATLKAECGGGNACAAWSSSYLEKENLSPKSSLHHIADWYESIKDSGYNVHSKRVEKLEGLISSALESEWLATHVNGFYSYLYPGSFDIDKHAPLIASALKASQLNISHPASALPLAKSVVKNQIVAAMSVAESKGEAWLAKQIGDFQRYISIIHAQNMSTGHFASGEIGTTALLSEPLPAHLLRYMTLDVYYNLDDSDSTYYSLDKSGEDMRYDVRLHASIDELFSATSALGKKIDLLVQMNENFTELPGRTCQIMYPPLREALFKVAGDESLYWLTPFSDWFNSVTRQQLELFSAIRFGVIKQNELRLPCDLSPNNPQYW